MQHCIPSALSNTVTLINVRFSTVQDDPVDAVPAHDPQPNSREDVRSKTTAGTDETSPPVTADEPCSLEDPITKDAGMENCISIQDVGRNKYAERSTDRVLSVFHFIFLDLSGAETFDKDPNYGSIIPFKVLYDSDL